MSRKDPRKERILQLLEVHYKMSNEALREATYLSRSTLRRILLDLEKEGRIHRFYGGVLLAQKSRGEESSDRRSLLEKKAKEDIALRAADLLQDDLVLFLDSSSTVSYLRPYLLRHRLKIITNNIELALRLRNEDHLDLYLVPGRLHPKSTSTVGSFAPRFLADFHADLCFFSCKAANESGMYEGDVEQAEVKRTMLSRAKQTWLLCDASKFHKDGFFCSASFESITGMITNAAPPPALARTIREKGCELRLSRTESE